MEHNIELASTEKKAVALWSVLAAIFITGSKLVVGLMTGSLGIISEALHSALDFVASVITYFSVRISDKPADSDHNWGHGKVENLSALVQTILLLITCAWIIYEAISRLLSGEVHIIVNVWSYIVIIVSIIIDIQRSRALSRVAKKHNSQALEADALHFSTDIWSSSVVLIGLVCYSFGFFYADSIAALFVAFIVIIVCYRLGKRAIDALLDRSPADKVMEINLILTNIDEITNYHDVKVRASGADILVELNIHVNPRLTIEEAHKISHKVEKQIKEKIGRCNIHIHTEPEEIRLKN